MTTLTWSSGVSGDWNTAANWAQASVPGAGDTAVITAGTAQLLSGVDPASGLIIDLGGPTISSASGPLPNAYLDTLNNTIGPNVTVADVTAGTEGAWASRGITAFTGVLEAFGTNTLMVLGVDKQNPIGIKAGPLAAAVTNPVVNTVVNLGDIGQFQNNGTISVSGGAALLITPLNTLDNGQVSMLIGTINLDGGTLASTYVTLGDPAGGFGTSGTINMAHGSTALMQLASNIDVNFQDGTGNRLIFNSTTQTAVISGFQAGDSIEQTPLSLFGNSQPYGNTGLTYNTVTHVLEIATGVGGTPFLDYTFAGTYAQNQFHAADDASGNLIITLACFAAGTRIATGRGEVAVEALREGDMVATARTPGAPAREVQWVGHRHVDLCRHPDPQAVRPIRVRAGAFDGALPHRDLWLSPDHALFVGGVLVPVRYLSNGASIARDDDIAAVTYFHVELASHDVILAEGLPVESYLDTGNRHHFSNGGTFASLYADFSGRARSWEEDSCAPLRGDGPEVAAVRQGLLARALALGFTLQPGQELWLDVAGRRVDPVAAADRVFRFVLPADAAEIRLRSRAGVPAEVDPLGTDRRRLGAMVERITLRRGRRRCVLLPDDARLDAGFHAPEREGARHWRWTDGNGVIPAGLLPEGSGRLGVEVQVAALHPWWSAAPRAAACRIA